MINYAGDPDVYPATIRLPENNDVPSAAVLQAGLVDLADRTAAVARTAEAVFLGGQLRLTEGVGDGANLAVARWEYVTSESPNRAGWVQGSVTGNLFWHIAIPVPAGWDINAASVTVVGTWEGNVHGANTPAEMPEFGIYYKDENGAWAAASSFGSDPFTGDVPGYETPHTVGIAGLPVSVTDPNRTYYLRVRGEAGADSVPQALQILAANVELVPTP